MEYNKMTFKDKIKGFAKKLAEKPVRNITALGLAGLITLTAVKDNVHFGSVTLHNPQENHYVWGLAPTTTIKEGSKNTNGNFYSAGIIYGKNKTENNVEVNDMKAYGLFGENNVGDNSKVNNMKLYGLIGGENNVGDNSKVNNMKLYGLIGGENNVGDNSKVNNMKLYGLIGGENNVGDNS